MSPAPVGLDAPPAAGPGERQTLTHAWLDVREPSKDGSLAQAGPSIGQIKFQFNPKELTLAKAAQWTRPTTQGNKRSSPPQYQGPQPSKLTLEMFFDASDKHDDSVVKQVDMLFACCVPTTASHDKKKDSPPWVLFRWGGLTGFLAYISSVSAKYTLFTAAGLPIRATCTVTLEELSGDPPRQNPTSGGLAPHREHILVEGDTLAGIAYAEYGDAGSWRAVAEINGIDDPMRLRPGRRLLLPAGDEMPNRREVARAAR
ncbi:MAG: LysM peptidoglycan-binding domain-containing protein [Brevundimonas sp.]